MTGAAIPDPYTTGAYALAKVEPRATAPASFPLRTVIEAHADVLAPLCPPGTNVETVTAQLYAATLRTPQITRATPESLIIALSLGIPTGGVIGADWYLLPFNKAGGKVEVSFAFDYKFLATCIIQAGGARSIDAEVVRKGDTFKVTKGSHPQIIHEPAPFGSTRGDVLGFYAVAHMGPTTPPKFVVLSLAEVEQVRAKSKQWGPDKVKVCPDWYGQARAVHRLGKLLPKKANTRLQHLESIMDSDARVDETPEAEASLVEQDATLPPHVGPGGEDLTFEPTPTTEPPDDETVTVDLATAERMIVSKRTIGSRTHDELEKLYEWAQGKHTETGERKFLEYMAAIGTIQSARATGEAQEPAKAPKGEA